MLGGKGPTVGRRVDPTPADGMTLLKVGGKGELASYFNRRMR